MNIQDFSDRLDQSTNDILSAVKPCSPEQLTFRKGEKWNIVEILEHLYLTDKSIYRLIAKPSKNIGSSAEIIGNEKLKRIMTNRQGVKITAPEFLVPRGDIKDINTFGKLFTEQRESMKLDLKSGNILIDNRIHKHPVLDDMTISDWLNFIIGHTQRHQEQIIDILKNVKA